MHEISYSYKIHKTFTSQGMESKRATVHVSLPYKNHTILAEGS